MRIFINNYVTTLASDINSDVGINLSVVNEVKLKEALSNGDNCLLTLQKDNQFEIINVSLSNSGDVTITDRGVENTVAKNWGIGSKIFCSVTSGWLNSVQTEISGANEIINNILGN